MDNRINKLQQYMEFYQKNHMGPQGQGGGYASQFGPGGFAMSPTVSAPNNSGSSAADWASTQLRAEDQSAQMQRPPDFFGGGSGGGQGPSANYLPPNMPGGPNPYTPQATQLNNDPYSGQGGQPDITNYLRKMMGVGGGAPPYRTGTPTVGIRG